VHVSGQNSKAAARAGVIFLMALAAAGVRIGASDAVAAAKVVTAAGRISVLRNGDLVALFDGQMVRVGETIVTGPDGIATLQISDGSSFDIYPNSRVVFRANPGNLRELVEVFLGKIKVRIQTFGGRPNPYRVHSPTAVISVRGTVFDVAVDSENITWVGVDEGIVTVEHRLLPGKSIPLMPGESLRIFPNASLSQAGVNKGAVAARVATAARDALYVLRTIGRPGAGKTPGGPAPAPAPNPPPVPTDKQAPPPPPPPPPPPGER
jgi:hypothetical protein